MKVFCFYYFDGRQELKMVAFRSIAQARRIAPRPTPPNPSNQKPCTICNTIGKEMHQTSRFKRRDKVKSKEEKRQKCWQVVSR